MKITTDNEIFIASQVADKMRRLQSIVAVGLGNTLCDVIACGLVRVALQGGGGDQDDMTFMGNAFTAYHYSQWHEGGVPRVRLSHGLATKLALTDPTGVSVDDVRMPFPSFSIELPFPNGPLVTESFVERDGPPCDVMFLYVSTYLTSDDLTIRDENARNIEETLRILKQAKEEQVCNKRELYIKLKLPDDTAFHTRLQLEEAITITDGSLVDVAEHTRRAFILAWRIVVNLALYLKMLDTRETRSSVGKTVNHDHGLHSLFYEIGTDVKLDRPLRDAARSFCLTGEHHAKWKLDKRFIVRGHWRHQACGPNSAERRLVFIEPFWKGPASAPVLARTYTDEPKKT